MDRLIKSALAPNMGVSLTKTLCHEHERPLRQEVYLELLQVPLGSLLSEVCFRRPFWLERAMFSQISVAKCGPNRF